MLKKLSVGRVRKGVAIVALLLTGGIATAQNVAIPADQQQFISIVTSFVEPYKAAGNELLKSRQRSSRKAALEEAFPSMEFNNWVGTLTRLGTTGDGDAFVSVQLAGSEIVIQTTNNSFSESMATHKTLVKDGTDVFEQLIQLGQGDIVVISGNFFPHDRDRFYELSLTENGSMTDPAYLIAVSSIGKTAQ